MRKHYSINQNIDYNETYQTCSFLKGMVSLAYWSYKLPASPPSLSSSADLTWKAWLPVLGLAFAAFIFNTTEFVPVGLLPDIASSFSMDVAHTGLLITGYAWVVAILSLPLTILTAKFERRKLLVCLFFIFIASHILAGWADSFQTLMMSRIGIACAHAIFWSISVPLAARMAPQGKKAKALAIMVTGSSLATIMGIPLGTLIGQQVGWRVTFLCIGGIAFLILLLLAYLLPRLPSTNAGSLKSLPSLLKRPALIHVYVLIAIIITGHFTTYTFITPFMNQVGGFAEHFIVYLLLFIGGSGILGSILYTRLADQKPATLLIGSILMILMCSLLIYVAVWSMWSTIILCMVWGIGSAIIGLSLQSKVLEIAHDATDIAISMFSGIFNIGIGSGALIGSIVVSTIGISAIGFVGAIFITCALVLAYFFSRKYWQSR